MQKHRSANALSKRFRPTLMLETLPYALNPTPFTFHPSPFTLPHPYLFHYCFNSLLYFFFNAFGEWTRHYVIDHA